MEQTDYRVQLAKAVAEAKAAASTSDQVATDAASAVTMAAAAQSTANAAQQLALLSRIDLGTQTVTFGALIAVAGVQDVNVTAALAQVGDRVNVYMGGLPSGYGNGGNVIVTTAGQVTVKVIRPSLAILTQVSFTLMMVAYRPSS